MTTKRVTSRLDKREYNRLKHLCHTNHLNKSAVIRALIKTSDPHDFIVWQHHYHQLRIGLANLETKINTNVLSRRIVFEQIRLIRITLVKDEAIIPHDVSEKIDKSIRKIIINIDKLTKSELREMNKIDNQANQLFKRNQ